MTKKKTDLQLLKESIADAKTIKKTAYESARASINESFTPHLKSMLASKIEEMDKEISGVEEDELSAGTTEDLALEESEEISIESLMAELEGDSTLNEEDDVDEAKKGDDEDEKPKPKPKAKDDEDKPKPKPKAKDDESEDNDSEEGAEGEEDGEIDLEDMSEDDLKGFIEGVIADMVQSGELEPGEAEDGDETGEFGAEDELGLEDDSLEGGFPNLSGDGLPGEEEVAPALEKQLFEAKAKIKKLEGIVKTSARLLAENKKLNIFNSKLLYTNKIFKNKTLQESQKVKVLKAFDKASSVKEAKMIYETLNTGLVSNNSSRTSRNMNFASNTRSNTVKNRKPLTESIVKTDPMVKYFDKIAFDID